MGIIGLSGAKFRGCPVLEFRVCGSGCKVRALLLTLKPRTIPSFAIFQLHGQTLNPKVRAWGGGDGCFSHQLKISARASLDFSTGNRLRQQGSELGLGSGLGVPGFWCGPSPQLRTSTHPWARQIDPNVAGSYLVGQGSQARKPGFDISLPRVYKAWQMFMIRCNFRKSLR